MYRNTFRLVKKKNIIIPFTQALRFKTKESQHTSVVGECQYILKYMVENMRNAEMYWFDLEEVDENYVLIIIKDSRWLWYYHVKNTKQDK